MKILAVGKAGKIAKYVKPEIYQAYEIINVPNGSTDEAILAAGADAEILTVDAMTRLSGNVIRQMPNLKMIHSEGVGYQAVDVEAARECGVPVCNCRGMNAKAVAEATILLMLAVLKNLSGSQKAVYEGRQIIVKENFMVQGSLKELADLKIGLIGMGDIARETAKMCQVFGPELYYWNRHRKDPEFEEKYHLTYLPLEKLLAECDMISLHVAVTPETTHMADAAFFRMMKEGAYFINTSRGELMDSQALVEALRSGHLAGAGLDVLEKEPVQLDNPVVMAEEAVRDKIVVTPHVAGITASSFRRGYEIMFANIAKVAAGERPDNIVNGV